MVIPLHLAFIENSGIKTGNPEIPSVSDASNPVIEARNLNLWFGDAHILKEVSMKIRRNKVTALIGPSGCGKSTLLRCFNRLNDLIDHTKIKGEVTFDGENIYANGNDVVLLRKRIGMVFQKPNPFQKSVYENIAYPIREHFEKSEDASRAWILKIW
ncbi:MAG TPA: ATP-binding cassette domain-containing protein, partial [Methanoregulaceae archaeon]|nr:ATP-binding cassette domain-containing protein [Methanoregulaceae archaeon]